MTPIPSPRSKRRARIEIIPLIDIIFFLLATFVMVSLSMVKNRAIPVNLPAASTSAAQEARDFATISISAAGNLFFNKQPVDSAGLDSALAQLQAANPDPRVFIHGDADAAFGKAIAVLDQVRRLGITKVAIETQPKPEPTPSNAAP
jgi:biopolymer transport protein ExbD